MDALIVYRTCAFVCGWGVLSIYLSHKNLFHRRSFRPPSKSNLDCFMGDGGLPVFLRKLEPQLLNFQGEKGSGTPPPLSVDPPM